ncbi:hypothetical protein [Chitinophaga caseinilytica]|uniref:hypothetical protein n=1 Tax=Chitinophaga caseinilytica TaxID=2267521 RepID=UPI003C2D0D27
MTKNMLTFSTRMHTRIPLFAALLSLAACSSNDTDVPKPIIDPVEPSYQLDWEVDKGEMNPVASDTTYFLYNANGTLDRITFARKAEHGDTSKYTTRFVYEGEVLKRVLRKGRINLDGPMVIISSADVTLNGNTLSIKNYHTTGYPQITVQKYTFENNRPIYLNDTSYASNPYEYIRCIWNGDHLSELWSYNRTGPGARDTVRKFTIKHTYLEEKSNPYITGGIAFHYWLHSFTYSHIFSSGLILKKEEINHKNEPFHTAECTWEFNTEGLPVKMNEKQTSHSMPGSPVNRRDFFYGYSKR